MLPGLGTQVSNTGKDPSVRLIIMSQKLGHGNTVQIFDTNVGPLSKIWPFTVHNFFF